MRKETVKKLLLSTVVGMVATSTPVYADLLGVGSDAVQVDVDSSGEPSSSSSYGWGDMISADGRYVLFTSNDGDLVAGDIEYGKDVFFHDRYTGKTSCASADSNGIPLNYSHARGISADGRYVLITMDPNTGIDPVGEKTQLVLHDMETGTNEIISKASDGTLGSWYTNAEADISADNRYIAFASQASNLVANDTNAQKDIFLHDRETGVTELVSYDNSFGAAYPTISNDGRYVAFLHYGALVAADTNGVGDVYVRDMVEQTVERVSVKSNGDEITGLITTPKISGNGRYVVFHSQDAMVPEDTNGKSDIYMHDIDTGITELVSIASDGSIGTWSGSHTPSVSDDGRYVTFVSGAPEFKPDGATGLATHVYTHDRETGETALADYGSQYNSIYHQYGSISGNGQVVMFNEYAHLYADDRSDIDIQTTLYDYVNNELEVVATSGLNADANLEVADFGPMTWNSADLWWEFLQGEVESPPQLIKICDLNNWCKAIR